MGVGVPRGGQGSRSGGAYYYTIIITVIPSLAVTILSTRIASE